MAKRFTKKIIFSVNDELYNSFHISCQEEYKSMSEVIRDFMLKYNRKRENDKRKSIDK